MFVDDVQENVYGAVCFGMTGHLFTGAQEPRDFLEQCRIL